MNISEAASRSGLSVSTIRYYEKLKLCPAVRRSASGKRHFTLVDVDWLILLSSLRETGMPLSQMRDFAELYEGGDATVIERKAVLIQHRQSLNKRQSELDRCRDILDQKLSKYQEILEDMK